MSVTSRSPLRVAGAVTNSGNVNTGEQNMTFGGAQAATIYSGLNAGPSLLAAPNAVAAGPDVLFFSGAGRLKDVFVHTNGVVSGQNYTALTFYDTGTVTSGGPFAASGHKVIGFIPVASGGFFTPLGYAFDVPFQSGLIAACRSGIPAFTVTYTPETNLPNPG